MGVPPGALPGQGRRIEGITGKPLFREDGNRQFVIREGQEKPAIGKTRTFQQGSKFFPAEGLHAPAVVAILDAEHGYALVILRRTGKIFEAQLVFDGQDKATARLEQSAHLPQHVHLRIVASGEQWRIFKHTDEGDHVETAVAGKPIETVGHHSDVFQVPCSRPGNARPTHRPLQGQHPGAALAQVAGDGPAAGPYFQHIGPFEQCSERPQDIGAGGRQVVEGRPVRTLRGQFHGKNRAIRCLGDDRANALLGGVAVAVGDPGIARLHENGGCIGLNIASLHECGNKGHDKSVC